MKKNNKRTLTLSLLAVVLCLAMLIGSTFAWFTDNASSGINTIQSGNLDLALEYLDAEGDWQEVQEETMLFAEDALWEPGYTEVVYLRVRNVGSLALKYRLSVRASAEQEGTNVAGEIFKLSDYIRFGQEESNTEIAVYETREAAQTAVAKSAATLKDYVKEGNLTEENSEQYIALVAYMPTTVGNEANYKTGTTAPSINLGVSIQATQYTYESDSYDNQYDADALFADQIPVASQEELNTAITEAGSDPVEFILAEGTYVLPTDASMQNKDITITGSTAAVIDYTNMGNVLGWAQDNIGTTLTFDGVTVNWQTGNQGYQGIKNPERVIYKNCTITGTQFMYSGADFINCTFTSTDYCVYLRANGDYTFTGCTFNTDGKAIMMYHDQGNTANVVLTDCKFYSNDTIVDKAAVETGDDSKTCVYNITFVNCTQEGFDINPNGIVTNSELWGNKNSIPTDRLNVIIDGVDVY